MSDQHLNNINNILKDMKEVLAKNEDKNIKIERALEAQRRKTTIPQEVHEHAGQHLKDFQEKTLTPEQHQKLKEIKEVKARRAGMHVVKEEECCKFDKNGQWSIEKSSYGPKGADLYNPTDNINRKANRTGEEVADAGRNVAVHKWTTSGSSTDKTRVNNMLHEQHLANKKQPVKTFISAEDKAAYEAKANADIKKEDKLFVDGRTMNENAGGKNGGFC